MITIRWMKEEKILSQEHQRKSATEIKKFTTSLNFKNLTKFCLNIQEVDTSLFKLLFFVSVRLLGSKLCPFKIDTFLVKKIGDRLIFAQSPSYAYNVMRVLIYDRNVPEVSRAQYIHVNKNSVQMQLNSKFPFLFLDYLPSSKVKFKVIRLYRFPPLIRL